MGDALLMQIFDGVKHGARHGLGIRLRVMTLAIRPQGGRFASVRERVGRGALPRFKLTRAVPAQTTLAHLGNDCIEELASREQLEDKIENGVRLVALVHLHNIRMVTLHQDVDFSLEHCNFAAARLLDYLRKRQSEG